MNGFYQQNQRFNGQQKQKLKERKKQTRLSISFKDDELWIYERLQEFSCPSASIKDLLKERFGGADCGKK